MSRAAHARLFAFALVGFFLAWLLPRLPALAAHTLALDDYNALLIGAYPQSTVVQADFCVLPPQDSRWLLAGLLCGLGKFAPFWAASLVPKLLAGLSVGVFCTLWFQLLVRWSVPVWGALLVALVFESHPILNEITLWNATAPFPILLAMCAVGYRALTLGNPRWMHVLGLALLLAVVLTYEIYLTAFLLLAVAEPVFRRVAGTPFAWRDTGFKLAAFAGVAAGYVLQVLVTRSLFGIAHGRGFATIGSLSSYLNDKLHGIANLLVNCYMTVLSYYLGLEAAWSAWKWLPLSLFAVVCVVARVRGKAPTTAFGLALFCVLLPVLPAAPAFLMNQSPESWRVSVPVLLACCLGLALLASLASHDAQERPVGRWGAKPGPARAVMVLLAASLLAVLPPTWAESRLRAAEYRADLDLLRTIGSFWSGAGIRPDGYRVGLIKHAAAVRPVLAGHARAYRLTMGYQPRGLISAFDNDFSWRGLLLLDGKRVVELQDPTSAYVPAGCAARAQHCRLDLQAQLARRCAENPDFTSPANGLRVVHSIADRVSAICT